VTARDQFQNRVPAYAGTVTVSSSDPAASLPPNSTLSAGVGIFSATLATPGQQTLTAHDVNNAGISGTSGPITAHGLAVTSLTATATGFVATFDKAFDISQVNIYDSFATLGADDVVITGPAPSQVMVRGSLLIDASAQTMTFIKTSNFNGSGFNPGTGLLAAGTYSVVFRSSANGFRDLLGASLDGNNDGITGDNYTATFVVAAPSAAIGVPSFARGPDNSVILPNTATGSAAGIPVNLSSGAGVTAGTFTLQYNSALLAITGATVNATLPAGASFTLDPSSTPGNAVIDFASPTALGAGVARLGTLQAVIPSAAASSYKAKALLHFTGLQLNGGAIPLISDDAIEVVAYAGDATGDGQSSGLDATLLSRVSINADAVNGALSGFAAFGQADPVIIGDLSSNGIVEGADITLLNSVLAGIPKAQVPPFNPNNLTIVPAGPDPALSVPAATQVVPGSTIVVPVNIDTARPAGSTGMVEAVLALRFDPRYFSLSVSDVQLGTVPSSGSGWQLQVAVNNQTGDLGIDLFSATPISSAAGGSLVMITLRVLDTAPPGLAGLELVNHVDPTGKRVYQTTVADALGAFVLG
jgi:hypothetical protein